MKLHLHPIAWEARLYDSEKTAEQCFEDQDEWETAALFRRMHDSVLITITKGSIDIDAFRQAEDQLSPLGVVGVEYLSKGSVRKLNFKKEE